VRVVADVLEVIRLIAVIAGLWYQAHICYDRQSEWRDLVADPEATPQEHELLSWHVERGWLLLIGHTLLLILTLLSIYLRSTAVSPPTLDEMRDGVMAVSDVLWAVLVVILTAVSWRARIHYLRLLVFFKNGRGEGHATVEGEDT